MNSLQKKIKVAQVIYDWQIGGTSSVVQQLIEERNCDVEMSVIILSDPDYKFENEASLKEHRLNYLSSSKFSLPAVLSEQFFVRKAVKIAAQQIHAICIKEEFDILHFHTHPRDLQIGKHLLKYSKKLSLVFTDHSWRISKDEYARIQGKILSIIYRNLYKVCNSIFVSKAAYEWALKIKLIESGKKNVYIENSIRLSSFKQKTDYLLREKTYIVYVSRISAAKGHFFLIKVAALLVHKYQVKNFEFVIIGPGELTEQLQATITDHNLGAYFQLRGPLQNVPSLLAQFDMAVFPSEREGLPVALLEKMAAGLPVVASDIPEIKNVIRHSDEALIYPLNNAEACAEQLYRLIHDQQLREKTGMAAREAVKERYSMPLLERYLAFYKGLA